MKGEIRSAKKRKPRVACGDRGSFSGLFVVVELKARPCRRGDRGPVAKPKVTTSRHYSKHSTRRLLPMQDDALTRLGGGSCRHRRYVQLSLRPEPPIDGKSGVPATRTVSTRCHERRCRFRRVDCGGGSASACESLPRVATVMARRRESESGAECSARNESRVALAFGALAPSRVESNCSLITSGARVAALVTAVSLFRHGVAAST